MPADVSPVEGGVVFHPAERKPRIRHASRCFCLPPDETIDRRSSGNRSARPRKTHLRRSKAATWSTAEKWFSSVLASGGSAIFGLPGLAQDRYPSRSLRLIVPHPVGGGVHIPARSLAEGLRTILGQPFVIDNKPGAGGMLGAQMAAAAPPDGYTLLMSAPSETAIAPYLYKSMTYDPVRDLQPITLCVKAPNVLVVGPSLSVHGVAELIAAAAEKPGGLTCGTSGIGSIQHLNLALFNKLADVKITHVPYKGSSPQNADLMAGQIHMGYASVIGVLPLIKSGRLRAIAVTSRERVEALPGVPTLAETPSLAGYDLNNWAGLFAPAGLPRPVLQTLHDAAIPGGFLQRVAETHPGRRGHPLARDAPGICRLHRSRVEEVRPDHQGNQHHRRRLSRAESSAAPGGQAAALSGKRAAERHR